MQLIRSLPFASLVLLLAACQPEPANPSNAVTANARVPPADEAAPDNTAAASNRTGDGAAAPVAAIPAALHGRWGLVPADCTSTRGDAKGLLTISADTLRFYESRARLAQVTASSPTRIAATFAFEGEGQSWTRTVTLELGSDGATLVRREEAEGERLSLGYRRC